ncbi:MAG: M20/M25/M40 family metallo-hydrolase [Rikenellaceae bacterium]|nr:M20/M25/M40 family metallo-hydrolase [Rikenellaceae bacterium]
MKTFLKILATLLIIIAVLAVIVIIKTSTYSFVKHSPVETAGETVSQAKTLSARSLERFAGGISIPTVSTGNYEDTYFPPFDRFNEYLMESYPNIYEVMDTMTINGYGLVFRWNGQNPNLKPILLLSHYDVVPVMGFDQTEDSVVKVDFRPADTAMAPIDNYIEEWEQPPFSGAVVNGRIYGRGTLDMKGMLFGLLEAADALIEEGFTPQQDIWFSFGHDEEVGGLHGATYIAEWFLQQGITFDAVYDEGGIIDADGLNKVSSPIALVGIGEKGFLTLQIKVAGIGGHSSMPPKKGSLVMAAEIMEKLNNNQMKARIIPPISDFLDNIGGEQGFATRMAIANKWLFNPLLIKNLEKTPASNALVRTTTAVTRAKGSDAANVLSSVSEITVNFRLLPGDTVEDVLNHVRKICEGYDTEIEIVNAREASGLSSADTKSFRAIKNTVEKIYPGTIVTTYVTIGGTDAYKYQKVSDNIYRFMPVKINNYEQRTIHNENEYISVENFSNMVAYFTELIRTYQDTE